MKDLLGDEIEESDEYERYLKDLDEQTLSARARNLEFVCSVAPDAGFMMPPETFHVFTEARDSFIAGLYVATLLLTQSFVEHRLQIFMSGLDEATANRGLKAILDKTRKERPEHRYLLDKIDEMRKFRNPITHLKDFDHPNTITQQSLQTRMHPNEVLYRRAKDSIAIMYAVSTTDWC